MCRTLAAFPTTCLERAKEFKTRLGIFLHKSELGSDTGSVGKWSSKHSKEGRNFSEDVLEWKESFDLLLSSKNGVAAFHAFLKTEFSEENLEFWLACEEFKQLRSATKLASRAHKIFEEFIRSEAPKEVRTSAFSVNPPDPACSFPTEDWWGAGGAVGEGLSLERHLIWHRGEWASVAGDQESSVTPGCCYPLTLRLTDGARGLGGCFGLCPYPLLQTKAFLEAQNTQVGRQVKLGTLCDPVQFPG
uniref:Regulator of G-protein signaling 16 n=1 Tax=Ailuropoda melanoleuca TaxID=9646 RepID=A0A7N5JNJ5_AILME